MATDKLLQRASTIVDRVRIGVLMTVAADGTPHGRWMGASTQQGLSRLYTLTAKGTRKFEHIRQNPRVSWMFTSADFGDVVTLAGSAVVHEGGTMVREAWDA